MALRGPQVSREKNHKERFLAVCVQNGQENEEKRIIVLGGFEQRVGFVEVYHKLDVVVVAVGRVLLDYLYQRSYPFGCFVDSTIKGVSFCFLRLKIMNEHSTRKIQ